MRTLLDIGFDGSRPFNQSPEAIGLTVSGAALKPAATDGFALQKTSRIRVERSDALAKLTEFTVELRLQPDAFGRRQVLIASDSPPVQLELDRSGIATATVTTDAGPQKVVATKAVAKGRESQLRLSRSADGALRLELDGALVGKGTARGALVATGAAALSIGTDTAGESGFVGVLNGVRIVDAAITAASEKALLTKANAIKQRLVDRYGVGVSVYLEQGQVDQRFTQIKAIMRAAGVSDLSSLSTLTINRHTTLMPGTILKASTGGIGPIVNWPEIATQFATAALASPTEARKVIDSTLLSRSVASEVAITITEAPTIAPTRPTVMPDRLGALGGRIEPMLPVQPSVVTQPPIVSRPPVVGTASALAPRSSGTGIVSGDAPATARAEINMLSAIESVERLRRDTPWEWPIHEADPVPVMTTVLPVNSAVIIARRLDLTNQTLEIDPAVGTLYIIAEEVEAASGARITWKRSALDIPNIGPDPGLNGQPNWSGVHTGGSKHGLPGGDARGGAPGITGRNGHDAPNVEIWALRAHGMPDIDLEGQDGGQGGRGQQGGRGGHGADGEPGEWYWFFGRHCWEDPGNGGDGGRGGDGGPGARGGDGGDGGDILFAVLEETARRAHDRERLHPRPRCRRRRRRRRRRHPRRGRPRWEPRASRRSATAGRAGAQGQPGTTGAAGLGRRRRQRRPDADHDDHRGGLERAADSPVAVRRDARRQPARRRGRSEGHALRRYRRGPHRHHGSACRRCAPTRDWTSPCRPPWPAARTSSTASLRRAGEQSAAADRAAADHRRPADRHARRRRRRSIGRAFVTGATVDYAGALYPATVTSAHEPHLHRARGGGHGIGRAGGDADRRQSRRPAQQHGHLAHPADAAQRVHARRPRLQLPERRRWAAELEHVRGHLRRRSRSGTSCSTRSSGIRC